MASQGPGTSEKTPVSAKNMAPIYKVAVIQMHPQAMDLEGNYGKAQEYIRSAASQGAQLAVLPEYHLTSWVPNDPAFKASASACKFYVDKYRALAKECRICIVPGTIIERRQEDEKNNDSSSKTSIENVAYFINPDGEIAGRYVKKNLWGSLERLHLTSSGRDPHPVFDTHLGKVGILVCWDLAFPEAFRELILQGAKLIIIPTFWTQHDCSREGLARNPRAECLFLDSILTARTFENTCAVIFANAGGPSEEGYLGLSQVCAPYVGPIGRLGEPAEAMLVVDLDMQILEEAENNYQVRADLAQDGWHYGYRYLPADPVV